MYGRTPDLAWFSTGVRVTYCEYERNSLNEVFVAHPYPKPMIGSFDCCPCTRSVSHGATATARPASPTRELWRRRHWMLRWANVPRGRNRLSTCVARARQLRVGPRSCSPSARFPADGAHNVCVLLVHACVISRDLLTPSMRDDMDA